MTGQGEVFADVPPSHPFPAWIEALFRPGITGGCGTHPALYCADTGVTRGQMAVFLLRGIHGATYEPPDATGGVFTDVSTFVAGGQPWLFYSQEPAGGSWPVTEFVVARLRVSSPQLTRTRVRPAIPTEHGCSSSRW